MLALARGQGSCLMLERSQPSATVIDNLIELLQRCRQKKNFPLAKRLHAYLRQHRLEDHGVLGNHLVQVLVECGSLHDAQQAFDRLPYGNVYSWTSLINGYVNCGNSCHAFDLYHQMQQDHVQPSKYTFVALLKACTKLKDNERYHALLVDIVASGLETDLFIGNTLLDLYNKWGFLEEAEQLFRTLPIHDAPLWNTLMAGYINHGHAEKALACSKQMQLEGVSPDDVTFACSLKACGNMFSVDRGQLLHSEVIQKGFEGYIIVSNTLIDMYGKCGCLTEAHKVFDKFLIRDAISWNVLIARYADYRLGKEALMCYRQMQSEGVCPDDVTFSSSLKACGIFGALETGQELYSEILKRGLERCGFVSNTLIDFYAKCGSLAEAHVLIDRLLIRDAVAWNALIAGYAKHGLAEETLTCYEEMLLESIPPDEVTIPYILKACDEIGDFNTGQGICTEMMKRGLEIDHVSCSSLISMYGKHALSMEAQHFMDKLSTQGVVSWSALVAEHGFGEVMLRCFDQIQLDNECVAASTFVCSLKACAAVGAFSKGQEIHAEIIKIGLEKDSYVGNALADMYSKCGSLAEGQKVFSTLAICDVVSWNALIAAYAEDGLGEEALSCLEQMQLKGISSDNVTYASSLKACGFLGAIEKGQLLYAEITQRGLESDLIVANTLIDMYGKCGCLLEAHRVLHSLHIRDAVSWNILMAAYVNCECGDEALSCYAQMHAESVIPVANTYTCSLKACSITRTLETGQQIHMSVIRKGLDGCAPICNVLVDMYGKCGSLVEAQEVFDMLHSRDVFSWNALIAGYAEHGYGQRVLACLGNMQSQGVLPNDVTFSHSLKVGGILRGLEIGQEIHSQVIKQGLEKDVFIGSMMVDMYGKCSSLREAHYSLDKLANRDTVSWNALIAAYAEHGLCEEALRCLNQMELDGVFPSAATYSCGLKVCGNAGTLEPGRRLHAELVKKGLERDLFVGNTLVSMYCKCGSLVEGWAMFDNLPVKDPVSWTALTAVGSEESLDALTLSCFKEIQGEGISPTSSTFLNSLKACDIAETLEMGWQIHTEITKRGLENELFLGNAMVAMYGRCGSLAEAKKVFDNLQVQDIFAWNGLIASYAECGLCKEAMVLFKRMQLKGISPDKVTFLNGLKACGILGILETGQELHVEATKTGLDKDHVMMKALLYMYGKCSSLAEARQVFDKLSTKDVISWTAMIQGYGDNDEGNLAIQCFEDMQEQGVKPNAVTFICLLTACSRANLVLKGQEYFEMMRGRHGIGPTVDHYACMVDLLGRSGDVYGAEKTVEAMQYFPSKEIMRALLTACKTHGDMELGWRCFRHLVSFHEEDAAAYLLMSDIYASAARWTEAKTTESMRA